MKDVEGCRKSISDRKKAPRAANKFIYNNSLRHSKRELFGDIYVHIEVINLAKHFS